MSDQTTRLQLPFLAAGQAQKHVTVNKSLLRLDALVQLAAVSASAASQLALPTDGDIYILSVGKSGADWGARANSALVTIATRSGRRSRRARDAGARCRWRSILCLFRRGLGRVGC